MSWRVAEIMLQGFMFSGGAPKTYNQWDLHQNKESIPATRGLLHQQKLREAACLRAVKGSGSRV